MAKTADKIAKLELEAEELEEKIKEIEWKQREVARQSLEKREEWNANPDNIGRSYTLDDNLEKEYWDLDDEKKELDYRLLIVLATIEDLENPPEMPKCSNCGREVTELDEETDLCKKCTRQFQEGDLTGSFGEQSTPEDSDPWEDNKEETEDKNEPECSECGEILETYEEQQIGLCKNCSGEEEENEEDSEEEDLEEEEPECSECGEILETKEEKELGVCENCQKEFNN